MYAYQSIITVKCRADENHWRSCLWRMLSSISHRPVCTAFNIITWVRQWGGVLYSMNPNPRGWDACYTIMARHVGKTPVLKNLCVSMDFDFLFSCIHSSRLAKRKYFHKDITVFLGLQKSFHWRESSVVWEVCLLDETYYSLQVFVSNVSADSPHRWVYTSLLGRRGARRKHTPGCHAYTLVNYSPG